MKKSYIYVIIAACFWGTMGIFVNMFDAMGFGRYDIVFLRSALTVALLFLYLIIFDRKSLKIHLKDIWMFIGSGICSFTFFTVCYVTAINNIGLCTAAVLLYTAPAFVCIMSALFFKESLTKKKIAALAMALCGCGLVSGILGSSGSVSAKNILIGLGAGLGYALYSIFGRFALKKYSSMTYIFYTFIFAFLGSLPLVDFENIMQNYAALGATAVLKTLILTLVTATLPYIFYTKGLEKLEASKASITATLEPVVASLFGIFLFAEPFTIWTVLGILLVLSSVVILSIGEKK